MIESSAYDLIKQEGMREGIKEGLQRGKLESMREGILDLLDVRFETVPASIISTIGSIEDLFLLKRLHRKAAIVRTLEEFTRILEAKP